jgi:hypothetical protein
VKTFVSMIAVMLCACASHSPEARYSATNSDFTIRQAEIEGIRVTTSADGTRIFCGSEAMLGSHIVAPCMTEAQWNSQQLWIFPAGYIPPPPLQTAPY